MTFTKDEETKMSQASNPTNQTPSAPRVTRSKVKDGSSKVVTDDVPIFIVPNRTLIKKKTMTPAVKKTKSSCVSVSDQNASMYIDPIKIQNVSHNVTTSTCDPIVTKIIVETPRKPNSESRSPANPRSSKNVSQEITTKNSIGTYVYESTSKTLVDDPILNVSKTVDDTSVETLKETMIQSDVTPDIITFVLQSDAPIVASHDNPRKDPESESVPEGEKSQQKETTGASEGNMIVFGNY